MLCIVCTVSCLKKINARRTDVNIQRTMRQFQIFFSTPLCSKCSFYLAFTVPLTLSGFCSYSNSLRLRWHWHVPCSRSCTITSGCDCPAEGPFSGTSPTSTHLNSLLQFRLFDRRSRHPHKLQIIPLGCLRTFRPR